MIESNLVQTGGVLLFNELIATSGVKSIELNGFVLSNAVTPAVTNQTGIFLYGGVQTLSFASIDAQVDTAVNSTPYQVVIGDTIHAAQGPAVDLPQQHHQPRVQ